MWNSLSQLCSASFVWVAIAFLFASQPVHATVPGSYLKKPVDWFRSDAGREAADNVLTWQLDNGSWPKNKDTAAEPYSGDRAELQGTFDNGATTSELRFLALAMRATQADRYQAAFIRGMDLLLNGQYPTGGWPQRVPPGADYHRHITFNDNCMVRILELLRRVDRDDEFAFVDADRRAKAATAVEAGVNCILDAQIIIDGRPTVWCAQHDELDLSPRPARSYELVSLSGAESAGILRFLMSIEHPSPRLSDAIHAGAAWYEESQIRGIRIAEINEDAQVVSEPDAPALWARFYDIETNQPFFCGRDGKKKESLADIERERRVGYSWYGDWGDGVAENYQRWKQRWSPR